MTNPTSNYGWQMPTSTDLVTDLPADFEVFGQAVDTSLLGLKGGTTGQVLSKTSGTDMAFTWIPVSEGDITGVTAGTGISGGGTSGDVTVTNSMATTIDAKGDLIGGTADNAFARLAVGANDTVLTADSTTATGLKWAAAAGGGKVLQVVTANYSTQTIIASGSDTDSGLTATITPTLDTSKILILVSQPAKANIREATTEKQYRANFKLFRGSSEINSMSLSIGITGSVANASWEGYSIANMNYLDSPATTAATTYKTQGSGGVNAGVVFQQNSATSTMTLLEIGA